MPNRVNLWPHSAFQVLMAVLVVSIVSMLPGCSSGSKAAATLSSIAVTPATATINAGATQQFTATGTFSDNSTQDLTASATWTSSNTAFATVSGGLATGVATGTATITATSGTVSGTASLTVNVAPTLVSIAVGPANPMLTVGGTLQFAATGTYSDGSTLNLTSTATWSSSSTSVATIAAGGLATGVAPGTTTITATSGTVSGNATLTVTATLESIAVTPVNPSIGVAATEQFTATGTYSDGSTLNLTSTATWSSSSTSVATIAAGGLATAVAVGSTTITATSGTVTGTTTLSVNAPGGSTSGSTAILVIPAPPGAARGKFRERRSLARSQSTAFIDAAYQPQAQVTNTNGAYTVQVVNIDTGTQASALLASIAMPLADSLGHVYVPNATGGSQTALMVAVISYSSPDVQIIDANTNTLVATYTSPVTQTVTFSGGSCQLCGVLINPSVTSNQVLLDTAQGYYTMDLKTGTFNALVSAYPAENFAFDTAGQFILSPTYTENGTPTEVQLVDLGSNTVSSNSSLNIAFPDSGAIDLSTNVGVVIDEETGGQTLINLSQLSVSSGSWTAPTTLYTIPLNGDEMTYCAVDSASHTLFTAEEFFANLAAVELLPSTTPTGAPPNPTGYVWGSMPNTPDGLEFLTGADPHAVSIFTSVVDGKLYGFLADYTQTWVAKIDLAGALAAGPPGQIDFTPYTTYLPTTQ
jgi:uncharacterized protein YjdB